MATVRSIFDIVDTSTNQVGSPKFSSIFSVCSFFFFFFSFRILFYLFFSFKTGWGKYFY